MGYLRPRMGSAGADLLLRRGALLLLAAPALVGGLAGLGAAHPCAWELLGAGTLALLAVLAVRRLRRGPAPSPCESVLALAAAQGLALAVLTGGRWSAHPGLEVLGRLLSAGGVFFAACGLCLPGLLPPRWLATAETTAPGLTPGGRVPPAVPLLGTAPALLAVCAGLGESWPLAFELLGAATLALLGGLAWLRLRRSPAPGLVEVGLACAVGEGMALATLGGGRLASVRPGVEAVARRLSLAAALGAAVALLLLLWLPRLRAWWSAGVEGLAAPLERGAAPARGRQVILIVWALFHLPFLVALPPLIQFDSWMNVLEPDLFLPATQPLHHPPIYSELIKAAAQAPSLVVGLTLVVALQHALVLGIALLVEDALRRVGAGEWVAAAVGCALAADGTLVVYAQLIMSEVVATAFLTLAAVCLVRGEEPGPAGTRLLAAGAGAALATLTRQVVQLWFALGLFWLAALAAIRGRARACTTFAAAALLPVLAVVGHQYVFYGRASLTGASGRSLVARLTVGLPDLTDPQAGPDDELERARRIVWRERRPQGWHPIHQALRTELGWDDERIAATIRGFYLEQIRRHPLPFARQTLRSVWSILRGSERFVADILGFHDQVRARAPLAPWAGLPPAGPAPPAFLVLDWLTLTQTWPVLLLGALSPWLAGGRARRLALLSVATAAYLVAIPALFEEGLPRYRMPAVPFLALAAGLGAAGIVDRFQRARAAS